MSAEPVLIACGKQMVSLFNDGDARGLAAYYAEDAVFMGPDGSRTEGQQAIERRLKSIVANGDVRMTVTPVAFRTSGDLGFVSGSYAIWSGDREASVCNYVEIWIRVGDKWQIAFDIMNRS